MVEKGSYPRRSRGPSYPLERPQSTPSRMKRSYQRQTTGFALPHRRMIWVVPQPLLSPG